MADKNAIGVIIGKLKGENHQEPEGNDADLTMAADEILSAIEAKDSSRLKDALYGFFEICYSGESSEMEEPESETTES